MNYPQAPMNNVIVRLKKKHYDTISFDSGITLHVDPTWHPEEFSMLEAEVVSVPRGIINRFDYEGFAVAVKPGDKVLIRYDVVFSYIDQPDRDTPIYKNMFLWHNGDRIEELWLCDIQKVFGVLGDNNEMQMVNGYVWIDPVLEDVGDFSSLILRPDHYKKIESKIRCNVHSIELGEVNAGDQVYIKAGVTQVYNIDQRKICIIRRHHILAMAG